jgi:hypothetical protein
MRVYIILSDGDTWDGLEGCRVVLAKEEHELSEKERADCIEYNPRDFAVDSVKLSDLASDLF